MERKNSALAFDTIFVSKQECFYLREGKVRVIVGLARKISERARDLWHSREAGCQRLLYKKEELLI